jgi:hypothetical protein
MENIFQIKNKTKKISYDKTMLTIVGIFIVFIIGYVIKIIFKRKKNNLHIRSDSKESVNEIFNISKNKISLITKFNTLMNKISPSNIEKYISDNYNKILGKDTNSYFNTIKSKFKKKISIIKNKKTNQKVKFDESNLIRDIYI